MEGLRSGHAPAPHSPALFWAPTWVSMQLSVPPTLPLPGPPRVRKRQRAGLEFRARKEKRGKSFTSGLCLKDTRHNQDREIPPRLGSRCPRSPSPAQAPCFPLPTPAGGPVRGAGGSKSPHEQEGCR